MKIEIGKYRLQNDKDVKAIPDGWEIFQPAVIKYDIHPDDFRDAYWESNSIIVLKGS